MFEMKMIVTIKEMPCEGRPLFEARVTALNGTRSMSTLGKNHPLNAIKGVVDMLTEEDFEFKKEIKNDKV